MTDMHDDYLDKAATRVLGYAAGYGDEHDLWVAEVRRRARNYRHAAQSADERYARHRNGPDWHTADTYEAKAEAMEALLRWENSLRGASPTIAVYLSGVAMCGHELTPENTTWEEGHRRCRTCRRATNKAARERRKQRGGPSFVVPLAPTCGKGHEYTPENTYIQPSTGGRACRECRRLGRSREVGRRRG